MGMASSQARLLALTGQLHNINNRIGQLQAEQMALTIRSDQIYESYNKALDQKCLQVGVVGADAKTTFEDIDYEVLCNYNPCRPTQYSLKDNKTGLAIVSKEIKQMYERFGASKYTFAYAMIGYGDDLQLQDQTNSAGISYQLTNAEMQIISDNSGDTKLQELYNKVLNAQDNAQMKESLNALRKYIYDTNGNNYGKEIFSMMNSNPDAEWADVQPEFDYYARLYEFIQECGGCTVIDEQYRSGDQGKKWLNYQISCGNVSISTFKDGTQKEWTATTISSSTGKNYLREVSDDDAAKKAEVEYEHNNNILKREEQQIQTKLSSLETEQSAIEKLIDEYKKFIDDNTKRTLSSG